MNLCACGLNKCPDCNPLHHSRSKKMLKVVTGNHPSEIDMRIVAKFITGGKKYLLTYGYGSPDFKTAIETGDFAVYYGFEMMDDDIIRRQGDKLAADEAVKMFGHLGLMQSHFRR